MSQIPPPPPGQPTPMGGTPSAAGSNKKTYSILAYLVGWITGLIFLFVGKDDPDVKWNAANSIVVFGGLFVIQIVVGFIPGINLILTPLIGLVSLIFWIIFLVQGIQGTGQRLPAPLIGSAINPLVDQVMNSVH
ncbi:MAG: hypothetical protein WB682_10180 [Candidatus Dormiibacterota bacterium]